MKQVTRWSPDTCSCVLEYEWDDEDDLDTRVHTFKRAVELCPAHEAEPHQNAYNDVVSENSRKNYVLAMVQETLPGVEIGAENYNWSFDSARMLHAGFLDVPGFPAVKGQIQAACNARFGPSKVLVL